MKSHEYDYGDEIVGLCGLGTLLVAASILFSVMCGNIWPFIGAGIAQIPIGACAAYYFIRQYLGMKKLKRNGKL